MLVILIRPTVIQPMVLMGRVQLVMEILDIIQMEQVALDMGIQLITLMAQATQHMAIAHMDQMVVQRIVMVILFMVQTVSLVQNTATQSVVINKFSLKI